MTRVGVISDTHGLVRPEALAALDGCDIILHAGDIGRGPVIERLAQVAPVRAIRGNVDRAGPAAACDETLLTEVAGRWFYLLHNLGNLDLDPASAGIDVVVSGHSHRPLAEERDGVLFLNPGSAGPRRFRLPVTLATLEVSGDSLQPVIVHLLDTP